MPKFPFGVELDVVEIGYLVLLLLLLLLLLLSLFLLLLLLLLLLFGMELNSPCVSWDCTTVVWLGVWYDRRRVHSSGQVRLWSGVWMAGLLVNGFDFHSGSIGGNGGVAGGGTCLLQLCCRNEQTLNKR